MAAVLWVCCSSYSYSDVVNGVTGNAAVNGLQWDMDNVLPPQAGLTVGGIAYKYSVDKLQEGDLKVTVQNEDKIDGGYVLQYTDDWSGKSGNRITKQYPLGDILIDRIGDGSIVTEGEGTVFDPEVRYTYTYDECYDVLSNPECPGYDEAYLKYLLDEGLIDLYGPDYDPNEDMELLAEETDVDEEELEEDENKEDEEDTEEEKDIEKLLSIAEEKNKLADGVAQQAMLAALSQVEKLNNYVALDIQGGEYIETTDLRDKKINDNKRAALRMGLANDQKHEEIVSSQYE